MLIRDKKEEKQGEVKFKITSHHLLINLNLEENETMWKVNHGKENCYK